jgi:integrating conjugative element protein (TIGR03757 family)
MMRAWLGLLALATSAFAATPITKIDVFVDDASPIVLGVEGAALAQTGTVTVWNLDDLKHFNEALSIGLSANPQVAAAEAAERIDNMTIGMKKTMQRAATGQMRADAFGIKRLPAVVINQTDIYLGPRSVDAALAAHRARNPQ